MSEGNRWRRKTLQEEGVVRRLAGSEMVLNWVWAMWKSLG